MISRKTWHIIGTVIGIAGIVWISQFFYFDSLTKKLSLEGVGPLFVGRLSENLQIAVTQPLTLHTDSKEITIEPDQLQTWIEPYHRIFTGKTEYRLNQFHIEQDLGDFVAGLAIAPVNASFGVASGSLMEVVPAKNGQELDRAETLRAISQALIHNEATANLVIKEVEPLLNLAKLHQLGITALLGEGTSKFTGSPNARIHNIGVGSKKMNNIILRPGETFSFVDHLGDVDASTGYKPELVIKDGKIIPEYGGGVCQVSTTMFRAAIFAGLPIVERRAHSIPVRYYNPQGFDATIYPGSVDLKFTNDTPSYILIQSRVEGTTITFDIFGSHDGRTVNVEGPNVYESNPDGSLKAILYRTITRTDGTETKETYRSAYKSPALFQVIKNPLE
ncbi:MAG: VanW family protein [Patescibacteria group bacterium]